MCLAARVGEHAIRRALACTGGAGGAFRAWHALARADEVRSEVRWAHLSTHMSTHMPIQM